MAKVIVVSDSHGLTDGLQAIYEHHKEESEYFIHCGDSELKQSNPLFKVYKSVKGNCDHESFPDFDILLVHDKRIVFTHGHEYGVKFNLNRLYYFGVSNQADIICYGHSHKPYVKVIEGIPIVNPGSVKHNRVFGLKANTYAVITIESDDISISHFDTQTFNEVKI